MSSTTPWRDIVRLALIGTIAMVATVIVDLGGLGANPVGLIQPGADGPSVEIIRQDFPELELPSGLGLDGQQFYAVARDPFDLDAVSAQLDRPAYRLRRPIYPWLAWALHPTGGGVGLVLAFAMVGVLALAGGGIAAGALSTVLGGRPWPALLFPLLPGSYMSLRVSVADALALAFALGALAFAARHRTFGALALAVLAALTKETSLVVLVGWALVNRDRRSATLPIVGAIAAGAWAVALRLSLPAQPGGGITEIVAPFSAFAPAIRHWLSGGGTLGMLATLSAVVAAGLALARRGARHPLGGAIGLNLAFVTVMHWNVIGLDFGGTRSTMPLLALSLIALAAPAQSPRVENAAPVHGAAGMVGPGLESGAAAKR